MLSVSTPLCISEFPVNEQTSKHISSTLALPNTPQEMISQSKMSARPNHESRVSVKCICGEQEVTMIMCLHTALMSFIPETSLSLNTISFNRSHDTFLIFSECYIIMVSGRQQDENSLGWELWAYYFST